MPAHNNVAHFIRSDAIQFTCRRQTSYTKYISRRKVHRVLRSGAHRIYNLGNHPGGIKNVRPHECGRTYDWQVAPKKISYKAAFLRKIYPTMKLPIIVHVFKDRNRAVIASYMFSRQISAENRIEHSPHPARVGKQSYRFTV